MCAPNVMTVYLIVVEIFNQRGGQTEICCKFAVQAFISMLCSLRLQLRL